MHAIRPERGNRPMQLRSANDSPSSAGCLHLSQPLAPKLPSPSRVGVEAPGWVERWHPGSVSATRAFAAQVLQHTVSVSLAHFTTPSGRPFGITLRLSNCMRRSAGCTRLPGADGRSRPATAGDTAEVSSRAMDIITDCIPLSPSPSAGLRCCVHRPHPCRRRRHRCHGRAIPMSWQYRARPSRPDSARRLRRRGAASLFSPRPGAIRARCGMAAAPRRGRITALVRWCGWGGPGGNGAGAGCRCSIDLSNRPRRRPARCSTDSWRLAHWPWPGRVTRSPCMRGLGKRSGWRMAERGCVLSESRRVAGSFGDGRRCCQSR